MRILLTWPDDNWLDQSPPREAEIIRRRVASHAKWRRRRQVLRLKALIIPRRRAAHARRAAGPATFRALPLVSDRSGGTSWRTAPPSKS